MEVQNSAETGTIHGLIKGAAEKYKQDTAFIEGDKRITFEEVDRLSLRMAKHLLYLGLKKGDVLAAQLPNSWEFVITHLAASRIGIIFNPLSPAYRKKELAYMLAHCNTKALVTMVSLKGVDHEKLALELKEELPSLEHVIVASLPKQEHSLSFARLLEEEPETMTEKDTEIHEPHEHDPAIILFTSGTESNPKAVLHTYESFVPTHLKNGAEYKVTREDTILSLTPLCHMFSMPMILIGLHRGAKHYLYRNYEISDAVNVLKMERVSFLIAAPAHLIDMIHYLKDKNVSGLNLRLILTGGSKIPAQMVKDLRSILGSRVGAQWGMSELCAGTFTRPGDEEARAWETVGRVSPSGDLKILHDDGSVLKTGEVGEIAFKGDSLFKEYVNNHAATKEVFTKDGYFLTGDQGWLDEGGYLHFSGRTKDTINRGGLKFHASEIEEALQMHPKIQQAAVVSVPDERLGERGAAFISLRENKLFDLEEMKEYLLNQGFAKYKIPEYIEIKESLPATPSGKVAKGYLRKEVNLWGKH
ncbi:class I adenylate-forming enzyme family protein [Salibacterium aidingense]|uniref:class I adenylate-forming enzyme family protein n=1 Tax=Salibacterium aidingense TaxID=384933 RepID=UPI003BEC28AF